MALTLQLVLAFGHVHLDGKGGHFSTSIKIASGAGIRIASGAGIEIAPGAGIEVASGATTAPGKDVPDAGDGSCAICALLHLAGSLMPAVAAALPLPAVFGQWRCPDAALCFVLPASLPPAFAARAPPLA